MSPAHLISSSPNHHRSIRRSVACIAGVVAALGALVVPVSGGVEAASIVHVSPTGSDSNDGSLSAPVRTVKRAVALAGSGDTVQIESGTYHEQVQVYSKAVHLEAAPHADVVFDGARRVTGWTQAGNVWVAPWNTDFARAGAPHTTAERPEAGWPEQFFVDGEALTEVTSSAAVGSGTFFHDRENDRVMIGDNPTGRTVEGSDLAWAVYLNLADGSSLTGVTVRRYATQAQNMAAVRAYADNLAIEDVTIEDNAYMGISIIGSNVTLDGVASQRNGHLGVHSHRTVGLTVTDSTIAENNAEAFDPLHAAGGIKMTLTSDIAITDNTVTSNAGPGIWLDLTATDIVVTGNTVTGNSRSGVELELSARAIIADNIITGNGEAGIWVLESSDAQIWHNAIFDNYRDIWVEDGPRSDVDRIEIANNTMGGVGRGAPAILNVDDWTGDRSAFDMRVTLWANRYWMPTNTTTQRLSRWADWPYGLLLSRDLAEHRAATSQDSDAEFSRAAQNPYVRSSSDPYPPAGAVAGRPLTPAVAAALSLSGDAYAPGPIPSLASGTDTGSGSGSDTGSGTSTGAGSGSGAEPNSSSQRGLQPAIRGTMRTASAAPVGFFASLQRMVQGSLAPGAISQGGPTATGEVA